MGIYVSKLSCLKISVFTSNSDIRVFFVYYAKVVRVMTAHLLTVSAFTKKINCGQVVTENYCGLKPPLY